MSLWTWWRRRRACMHHNRVTGESWVSSQLTDLGRRKMSTCRECGRMWLV